MSAGGFRGRRATDGARLPAGAGVAGLRRTIVPPLLAGLACLAALVVADVAIRHESGLSGDEPFYDRMAAHPGGPHNFPYAYRVLVPWLVHALPFSRTASFSVLACLAIAIAAGALFALLGEFGVSPRLAGGLCLGFALSPTFLAVLVRHGRSIDPASVLVLTLGCLWIVRRQRGRLLVTVLVGVGVRESSLFLIPLAYAVWAEQPLDRRALRDVAAVAALPVATYLALRMSVTAVGRQYIPGYSGSFAQARWDIVKTALNQHNAPLELRRLAYTYGPVWLAAPLALRELPFARRGLVLVALCAASMTYAYDWGRVAFLAAPVAYVAAAHVVRARPRVAILTVAVLLGVDLAYAVYIQSHGLENTVAHAVPVF